MNTCSGKPLKTFQRLLTSAWFVKKMPHPIPSMLSTSPNSWHTLGTDIFYHRRKDFLVLIDNFSKFLIVRKIPNSTLMIKCFNEWIQQDLQWVSYSIYCLVRKWSRNSSHFSKNYRCYITPVLHIQSSHSDLSRKKNKIKTWFYQKKLFSQKTT